MWISRWGDGDGQERGFEDLDGARWTLKREDGSDVLSFFPAPRISNLESW
jgi:hypothetical protein